MYFENILTLAESEKNGVSLAVEHCFTGAENLYIYQMTDTQQTSANQVSTYSVSRTPSSNNSLIASIEDGLINISDESSLMVSVQGNSYSVVVPAEEKGNYVFYAQSETGGDAQQIKIYYTWGSVECIEVSEPISLAAGDGTYFDVSEDYTEYTDESEMGEIVEEIWLISYEDDSSNSSDTDDTTDEGDETTVPEKEETTTPEEEETTAEDEETTAADDTTAASGSSGNNDDSTNSLTGYAVVLLALLTVVLGVTVVATGTAKKKTK
ncbi:MAG: hypothetical protein LUI01_06810 [Firmicutes bacterium]|nr:hypothetical protein [Bacillota bacterium]